MMSAWEILADIADAMPLVAVTVLLGLGIVGLLYFGWRLWGRDE